MSIKHLELPDIGPITLQKRRGNRSLRITINAKGIVKVSLPKWAPYKTAIDFAISKRDWIENHRPNIRPLEHQTRIGKAHQLTFVSNADFVSPRTKIKGNEIIVALPKGMAENHPKAQKIAEAAAVRALKIEAVALLIPRIKQLADNYGFSYRSVTIKRLSSRWGSCDHRQNISLNCYLLQLPWHLIEYVLLHELVHTRILGHGLDFWEELSQYVDSLPTIRKEIRSRRPSLIF